MTHMVYFSNIRFYFIKIVCKIQNTESFLMLDIPIAHKTDPYCKTGVCFSDAVDDITQSSFERWIQRPIEPVQSSSRQRSSFYLVDKAVEFVFLIEAFLETFLAILGACLAGATFGVACLRVICLFLFWILVIEPKSQLN